MKRDVAFEHRRLNPCLSEPLKYYVCSSAKVARGRNQGINEEGFLLLLYPQEDQPQIPLCGKHSSHRTSNGTGRLLGRVESEICGSAELEDFLWRLSISLIQVLQEVRLVEPCTLWLCSRLTRLTS